MQKVPKEIQGPWRKHATQVYFADNRGGIDFRGCPFAEDKARLAAAAPEFLAVAFQLIEELEEFGRQHNAILIKESPGITALRAVIASATGAAL